MPPDVGTAGRRQSRLRLSTTIRNYHRTVADLPWQSLHVRLILETRRFFWRYGQVLATHFHGALSVGGRAVWPPHATGGQQCSSPSALRLADAPAHGLPPR